MEGIDINKRKWELMERDPEVIKFDKEFRDFKNSGQKSYGDMLRFYFIDSVDLKKWIEGKWNVDIKIDISKHTWTIFSEYYSFFHQSVDDGRGIFTKLPLHEFKKDPSGNKLMQKAYSLGENVLFYDKGDIPILIDPSTLTLKDAGKVKKAVWVIVEKELEEIKGKKIKGWDPSPPKGTAKELGFLYHSKEETFNKYLKWYDQYSIKGLPFRTIAFLEFVEKKDPHRVKDAERAIENRKGLIGEPIKGEDAVEKGVKLIYKAIYRKPYPSKRTTQKAYNCPVHGQSCPSYCDYQKEWINDFNKRNRLKPLYTDSNSIDFIEDPKGMQKPAKGKGSYIIGSMKARDED